MPQFDRRAGDAVVWLLLFTAPFWLHACWRLCRAWQPRGDLRAGGDGTQFPPRLYRRALFGHAAYFGLGAYGTALTIKYLYPSTPVAMLVGVGVSTAAAAA